MDRQLRRQESRQAHAHRSGSVRAGQQAAGRDAEEGEDAAQAREAGRRHMRGGVGRALRLPLLRGSSSFSAIFVLPSVL